jgi:hypothetical protein
VRSHAARQSHYRRWLQNCDVTDPRGSEGVQKVAQRQRNVLQSQNQYPINENPLVAARNPADVTASFTHNPMELNQLQSPPSVPKDARVWNVDPLPSLPPSNLAPSFLNSDWGSFDLPYEQCTCSLCSYPLPSPNFRQRHSRPNHTSNPALALGNGNADPFASLPIELPPCMLFLVDHCKIPLTLN